MSKDDSRHYKYYQPNEKDHKDKYGDCTIRALSKVFNISWLDAFDMVTPICREYQVSGIFDVPIKERAEMLSELGFTYTGISNKRGSKRPTVESFSKEHKTGTYIVNVANHVVAVVDGLFYDTWDSGRCCLYGYFELKRED